jgi:hypothetical protein
MKAQEASKASQHRNESWDVASAPDGRLNCGAISKPRHSTPRFAKACNGIVPSALTVFQVPDPSAWCRLSRDSALGSSAMGRNTATDSNTVRASADGAMHKVRYASTMGSQNRALTKGPPTAGLFCVRTMARHASNGASRGPDTTLATAATAGPDAPVARFRAGRKRVD